METDETTDNKCESMKKEDCRMSRGSEDKSLESSARHQSVRPKEYLLLAYSHRQRDKHKSDLTFGESYKPQTVDKNTTGIHMKRHFVDRKVIPGSRTNLASSVFPRTAASSVFPRTAASSVFPRTAVMPRSPFRTETKQFNTTHDVPFRSSPLNMFDLEELDREHPDVVAEEFHRRHDDFVKVLKGCSKNSKLITVLFSILAKITTAGGDHLIYLSSALRESLFIENIAVSHLLSLVGRGFDNVDTVKHAICILRYVSEHSYTSVSSFFGAFTVLSDLSQEIRASDICTPDIKIELDEFDQIRSKINALRLRQRKKVRTTEDKMLPPDSFRLIDIAPTAEELLTNRVPFLRKNKEIGSYNDLDHYLDVQFRLLREDFVAPLRESIQEFKNNMQDVQDGTRKVQDIRIYNGVKIAGTTTTYDGICHVLTFDTSKTQKVKWEYSKRLIYGSLLCLSYDNFHTIYFATVTKRDASDLMLGIVDVQFTCELETVRTIADQVFVMAESATYFEAYKHNLTALQLVNDLSFSQYIVDCEDNIKPPAYLRIGEEKFYDLTMLDSEYVDENTSLEEDLIENKDVKIHEKIKAVKRKRDRTLESVDILNERSWPGNAKLGLDDSQHRALKNALTHEFSMTQGPPGTGKTFIGLKVARALLANKAVWSAGENKQALLVVSYTNHTLDQFLCGIHSFFKGAIVRIGGRSANEEMQQHGIKSMYKYITADAREASAVAYDVAEKTEKRINELKRQIYRIDREIVMTDQLIGYMGRFQKPLEAGFEQRIQNRNQTNSEQLDLIHEWLGCGVLPSQPDIIVHFERNDIERKPLVQEAGKTNDEHHAANETSLETTPRYYEQAGCISKDIVKSLIETRCEKKKLANEVSISVAYKEIVPMNEKSKEKIHTIWKIRFSERWGLYKSWAEELKHDLTEKLKEYEENFLHCCQDIKDATTDKHIQALRQADVIGMTTTGAAKHYEILQSIKPKIVIVEEAAEVLEGHIITSLSDECEHLILIGDHKQLKPSPTVYQLAKKYNLDLSLFERMINNKVTFESLEFQHRMRPEIANIIRLFYPYLKDHELVLNKPDIRGVSKNVYFITHQLPEEEDEDSTSHLNKHEAQFMVGLCRYLLKQEYQPSQITVLTTYKAQMFYLRKLMPKESEFDGVNITVVDNYQGEENEIVLLSLVRSNASKKVGFLKTENRINVALSRARNGLYVTGNLKQFADASDTWAKIVSMLQKEDRIGPAIPLFCRNHAGKKLCAQTMKDFENAPEGGCSLNCDARLDCGHVCELKCHVYDTDHKEYKCTKQCIRVCPNGHRCFKRCFEDCGDCQIPVVKKMPGCRHEQTMPCFVDESSWECREDCERKCKNDHECSKMCFEDCTQCDVIFLRKVTKCGHDQLIPCFMEESQWKCNAYCEKKCKNNHRCKKLCSEDCGNCTVELIIEMVGCGHFQTVPCYIEPGDWKCTVPCEGILECGHKCQSLCADAIHNLYCTKVKSKYDQSAVISDCQIPVVKTIPGCGHEQTMPCFQEPLRWDCNAKCEKVCKNNHPCQKRCFQDCGYCHISMVKTLPLCGHKHDMPCFKDESSWICREDCERKCKNDHECSKMFFEDCTQCDVRFLRKVTKCGHDQLIPCFMEESQWKCNAYCEKKCKNNHRCKKLCSEDCGNCTVELKIEMVDCGHFQTVPCYIEPGDLKCTVPCEGILECGHKCQSLCADAIHNLYCTKVKSKYDRSRVIKYLKRTKMRPGRILCDKACEFILECGHKCAKTCHRRHTKMCLEKVTIQLEKCGHSAETECHRRHMKETMICEKPCDHILDCGHKCIRKCYKPHTTICRQSVVKQQKCGHSHCVPCHKDVETVVCMEPCEFKLECGHQCRKRWCSETVECPFPCQEKLDCGHACTNKCSKPHTSFCKVVVGKTLPCGHVKDLYCGVNVDSIKCTCHCKTVLQCGHICKNTCAEPHTSECEENVNKECNYGHKATAPCHKIHTRTGTECHSKCRKKLACGHMCSGSCFECCGGILHRPCSVCPVPDLKHHVSSQTVKERIPCVAKCQNRCQHRNCDKLCFEPCAEDGKTKWQCEEQCNSECEHYYCQKRSFEQENNSFCSETYKMIVNIAENMNKPRDRKRRPDLRKFHKSCGALVNTDLVETLLKQNIKGRHKKVREIDETTCVKIASKLHEYEEKEKLKSKFYSKHKELHERLVKLESQLDEMNPDSDLYKIYESRLEYVREHFRNLFHFQKQGYKDLKKEIDRLERMARTILSMQK